MLVKQIQKKMASLCLSLGRAAFSQEKKGTEEIPITKHNPEGIADLRGFHNLQKLDEAQRDFSPLHSTKTHIASTYFLCSFLPNFVARFIGRMTADPKSTLASDLVHLPKIYPEAVAVYDCISSVNNYLIVNKATTLFGPALILAVVPEPTTSLLLYGLGVSAYNYFNWKIIRDLVIKAELLANTEEIVYQKITVWGSISTRKVKIQDLEATTLDELFGEINYQERAVRGLINKQVAFRIKGTGELLFFDKNGIWQEQGINHTLLI